MRTLLNPRWLWLLNTLPLLVLLAVLGGEYRVIRTLLPPESLLQWRWFGGALVALGTLHAAYTAWQGRRGASLPLGYALVALGAYIGFLYAYGYHLDTLFPREIPRWMVPGDLPLYAGTFLMPTLAHAAAVLVLRLTPDEPPPRALPSFGVALAVPVGWYMFAQLVLPLWQGPGGKVGQHALVVVLIASTLVFLLALARGIYIVAARRAEGWARYQWLWKLLIAGVLPLLGLAVNNGLLFPERFFWSDGRGGGVFGNFNGPWWYGLAVLNAGLLCVPTPAGPKVRLALYLGRGLTLAYTLYFFLVFLPFLPLSVVAVAAIGVGFLMLTPLALLVVHGRELAHDYAALRPFFASRWLVLGLVVAGCVLPLAVTLRYLHYRTVLHQALDYVYAPDYARRYRPLDAASLDNTLTVVRGHKDGRSSSFTGAQLPYLSAYFNWLVLDNLTLSESKLATLEQVFFNRLAPRPPRPLDLMDAPNIAAPRLTRLAARSRYDAVQQAWVSWVDVTVTNPDSGSGAAEYATTFELPAGCFVADYYLDIAGRREPGILAEKRAAAWVYAHIRNEQRDPGLLSYLSGNRLALRVFPFGAGEERRTGFRLLHKEPLTFTLDQHSVALGPARPSTARPTVAPDTAGGVAYVPAAAKAALPAVRRRPYYHFVLDMSAGNRAQWPRYRQRIATLLKQQAAGAEEPRYSLTNAYVRTLTPPGLLQADTAALRYEGGFYLDRAIRQVLVQAAATPAPRYPVIVVVSADFDRAVLPTDFADLRHALPDTDVFYELTEQGELVSHLLWQNPAARGAAGAQPGAPNPVVAWPNDTRPAAYLPATNQPDLVLTRPLPRAPAGPLPPGSWRAGLQLWGQWRAQTHHPETTETAGPQSVQGSIQSGILTPLTSYLALENEAQKAALRRKQAQLLAGHAALDAGEDDLRQMSEPRDWVVALGMLAAWLGWQWQRRRRLAGAIA
ncbi:MSEP-CTERM sorting domain-containing protein [Hymenobacter metallilatus]|uniref:MSEP-CTERM sorting domain-containing protein n=1 Tax=Hymenobacter metallilatus TaxID=2493666 RepID=UPI00163A4356|nr:MSEP-CTERM sorting domain-containing protein [Hymenobacter metallilatus]